MVNFYEAFGLDGGWLKARRRRPLILLHVTASAAFHFQPRFTLSRVPG